MFQVPNLSSSKEPGRSWLFSR